MSRSDGQRPLRRLVCTGCFRLCSYAKFRSSSDGATFADVVQSLKVESSDPSDWRYKRKGTVLGEMHARKMAEWSHMINSCPQWGDELRVGDRVQWDTRNGVTRSGVILAKVPAGKFGQDIAVELRLHLKREWKLWRRKVARPHDSWLVESIRDGHKQAQLMWPARGLELCTDFTSDLPF